MRLITSHGLNNNMNMWTFQNKILKCSNVNYQQIGRRTNKKRLKGSDVSSAYLKCNIFINEEFIFSPTSDANGEINVHYVNSGELIKTFSRMNLRQLGYNVNCIAGLSKDYVVLYSGSRNRLCTWNPANHEQKPQSIDSLHKDNWSDSE